jgi:hypothetical protein
MAGSYEHARMLEPAEEAADIIVHMINRRALGYKNMTELKKSLAEAFVKLGSAAAGTVCTGGPW